MSRDTEITKFYQSSKEAVGRILGYHQIPPEDSQDILQEIYLRLIRDWDEINNPQHWFTKTLKYRCLDYWRERRRHLYSDLDDSVTDLVHEVASSDADRVGLRSDVQNLLKNLRKRCRELLQLRFGFGLTSEEISPKIGCAMSSIPRLTQRCKTSFSQVLAKASYQRTV